MAVLAGAAAALQHHQHAPDLGTEKPVLQLEELSPSASKRFFALSLVIPCGGSAEILSSRMAFIPLTPPRAHTVFQAVPAKRRAKWRRRWLVRLAPRALLYQGW